MDAEFLVSLPADVRDWYESLSEDDRRMVDRFGDGVIDAVFAGIKSSYRQWGGFRSDTRYINDFGRQPAVYLFYNQTVGLYKIGYSQNIGKRVRSTKSSLPEPFLSQSPAYHTVRIVCAIPYPAREMAAKEQEWHDFFGEYRIEDSEWFTLTDEAIGLFKAASEAAGWVAEGAEGNNEAV